MYDLGGINSQQVRSGGGGGGSSGSASSNGQMFSGSYSTDLTLADGTLACDQTPWDLSEQAASPLTIVFRIILSVEAGGTAYVRLYNVTTATLVDIGGLGVTELSTGNATPTIIDSGDLRSAAGISAGQAIYEVQLYSADNAHVALLGSARMVIA